MKLAGIVLIILGLLGLVYQGFSYKEREEIVDAGPIEIHRESTKTIPLPPIAGAVALVGGIALVAYGSQKR